MSFLKKCERDFVSLYGAAEFSQQSNHIFWSKMSDLERLGRRKNLKDKMKDAILIFAYDLKINLTNIEISDLQRLS